MAQFAYGNTTMLHKPFPPTMTAILTPIGFPNTPNWSDSWKARSLHNKKQTIISGSIIYGGTEHIPEGAFDAAHRQQPRGYSVQPSALRRALP